MINKFLEMLGVELGEKFDLVRADNGGFIGCSPYHFEDIHGYFDLFNCVGDESGDYIPNIISGRYKIEKLPFKPKDSDKYWFINPKGYLVHACFCEDGMVDLYNFDTGNCFKTKEEAEANKDEIIRQFDEIKEELNA